MIVRSLSFSGAVSLLCLCLGSVAVATPDSDFITCQSNLKNVGWALDSYAKENGKKYPASLTTLIPKYLKSIPVCPSAGRETYSKGYKQDPKNFYLVSCFGQHHGALGYGENQPAYSGLTGKINAQPSAGNVKGARVAFGEIYKNVYSFQIPSGWMYKSGNAYGLSLENPKHPQASIACGDVKGKQDVDLWFKESLAELEQKSLKPIAPRLRTLMGNKGFQVKLRSEGRTIVGYYFADGEKNVNITLAAPDSQFAVLEKDFEAVLRTLQKSR